MAFLRLKNVAPGTIVQYTQVLKQFFQFLPAQLDSPRSIQPVHLREYVAAIQTGGTAPKTVSDRVTIFKRFFGYLHAEGLVASDPATRLPQPRIGKRLPKALSLEETEALLLVIPDDPKLGRRDRILFALIYAGGLRAREALNLRVSDLDLEDGSVHVIGKGNKERRVYLKRTVLNALRDYIAAANLDDYLFPGYGGKPMTTRNIELRIKDYAQAAGIRRRVTPHTLRHSIAVHYLQGGAPINFIQTFLGHAKLSTTGRYLQLTDQASKEIALKIGTALDPEPDEKKVVRERRTVWGDSDLVMWDTYLTDVVGWLAS